MTLSGKDLQKERWIQSWRIHKRWDDPWTGTGSTAYYAILKLVN